MDDQRRQWEALIRSLDEWSEAHEVNAGRIQVRLPEGSRHVVIEMTPGEWDEMSGVMWGSFEDALEDIKETLLALGPADRYASYADYRLSGSTTPRGAGPFKRERSVEPGGEWAVRGRDGVVRRLADWSDSEPEG